jgi:hypothetical protein
MISLANLAAIEISSELRKFGVTVERDLVFYYTEITVRLLEVDLRIVFGIFDVKIQKSGNWSWQL